jgi:hypothetical protein
MRIDFAGREIIDLMIKILSEVGHIFETQLKEKL